MCPPCARRHYLLRKREAYALLGNACSVCGLEDERVLQIDHYHDDGHLESTRRGSASTALHRDARRHGREYVLIKYQLLCANCHQIKTHHEREEAST